jgi:hypothetical protein
MNAVCTVFFSSSIINGGEPIQMDPDTSHDHRGNRLQISTTQAVGSMSYFQDGEQMMEPIRPLGDGTTN